MVTEVEPVRSGEIFSSAVSVLDDQTSAYVTFTAYGPEPTMATVCYERYCHNTVEASQLVEAALWAWQCTGLLGLSAFAESRNMRQRPQ